ncbi:hypothetical protein Tco_0671134 [Tanacetum coccineum]
MDIVSWMRFLRIRANCVKRYHFFAPYNTFREERVFSFWSKSAVSVCALLNGILSEFWVCKVSSLHVSSFSELMNWGVCTVTGRSIKTETTIGGLRWPSKSLYSGAMVYARTSKNLVGPVINKQSIEDMKSADKLQFSTSSNKMLSTDQQYNLYSQLQDLINEHRIMTSQASHAIAVKRGSFFSSITIALCEPTLLELGL